MKKYLISICLLIFCIFFAYRQEKCYAAQNQGQSVEVVLLIDTSKSMNDQLDRLHSWSNGFCLNCIDKNIALSYVTFNNKKNEKVIIKPTKINRETYNRYKEEINKEIDSFKSNENDVERKYTDQLGAFKKAEKILDKSNADIKYIIMLSDGELDYDNKSTITSEESKAICKLKEECMEFINANQKIILVGFGKHIELFQNIIDMEKKKGTSFIKHIDSSYDPAGVVNEFLSGIGNSKEVIEEREKKSINEISFKLEEEYDRVNILIENKNDGKVDFDKGVSVYYNNGKKEKLLKGENLLFEPDGNYLNIVLTSPKAGNYRISLPNTGIWYYKIWHWYTMVEEVKLSLFNNKKEVAKTKGKNGIICYEPNIFQDSLILKVELYIDNKVKKNEVKVKGISYLDANKASSSTMKELWNDKRKVKEMSPVPGSGSEWMYKLQLPLSESNNIYQARAFLFDGPYINTNKIKIVSKKIDLNNIPTIDKKIGNKIKLAELIQENYEDYIDYINKMKFIIGKDDASNDIKDEEYNLDEDKKEVVFEETGEYIIEMKKAGGETFAMVKINAKNDELYKLKKKVAENKKIIVIVAVILFVAVILVNKSKKKR